MKYIILILLFFSFAIAQTPQTCILGPGDGVSGGPSSDDLSSNGQNAVGTWKNFRWPAGGTGDGYFFSFRVQSIPIPANVTSSNVGFAILNDNAGSPGTLKMWGHEENYNFTTIGVGRHYFYIDSVASGQNRTITAGTYYWICWISDVANVSGSLYMERQGSDPLPAGIDKKGDTGASAPYTATPPSGSDYDIQYDPNNYYGWAVYTAQGGADVTPPADPTDFTASNATADSVNFTWTVTSETGATQKIFRIAYADRASLVDTTDGTAVSGWMTHANGDTTFLQDVNGDTDYEYRIFARDSVFNLSTGDNDSAHVIDATPVEGVAPAAVVGTILHGGTITVTGSGFGTKSPAPPLIWDDCESYTAMTQAEITTNGWADLAPRTIIPDTCYLLPRDSTFRSIGAPHVRSTKMLAGCHWQDANNDTAYVGGAWDSPSADVMLTRSFGGATARFFATYYYRLDKSWYTGDGSLPYNNHKMSTFQSSDLAYTPGGGFVYTVHRVSNSPANVVGNTCAYELQATQIGVTVSYSWNSNIDNPRLDWIRFEERVSDDATLGFYNTYVNNDLVTYFDNNQPDWFNGQGGAKASGIQSYTLGGYYRRVTEDGSIANVADYRGGDGSSNFRYFDDIYIDNSLARVMIGNASTYSACTIVEPQIPVTWATGSITVTVNQGKLEAGNVWIYVFNSDNDWNATGLAATLTETEPVAPAALKPVIDKIE